MLMPIEYALISQFAGFTALYFADTRATVRGWAPPWYATYRFVLTFIVGASIVISLIGRGEIAFKGGKLPSPSDGMRSLREQGRAEAGEKESIKEKRAEQSSPGMKSGAGKKMDKGNDEESDNDDGVATPDDSEDEANSEEGGDEQQQDDKKKNQDKKAHSEGSKQDEKAEESQKGKK